MLCGLWDVDIVDHSDFVQKHDTHFLLVSYHTPARMGLSITPLKSLRVSKHLIPAHGLIPNTSILNKPMFIYHSAFPSNCGADAVEQHLTTVGVVQPQWVYTMYSTSHFHSTSHEVLVIANGEARLCFGHEDNPKKVEETVKAGDVIVLPAGVSHRLLHDLKGGFSMVGSYPAGCEWDMCYGKDAEKGKIGKIKDVGWFSRDPIYGDQGPVLEA